MAGEFRVHGVVMFIGRKGVRQGGQGRRWSRLEWDMHERWRGVREHGVEGGVDWSGVYWEGWVGGCGLSRVQWSKFEVEVGRGGEGTGVVSWQWIEG